MLWFFLCLQAYDDGIEINHVTAKCQFCILPPNVEERVSGVAMQVKECSLFLGAYRDILDLR
jgi:hypothetical protein